MTDEVKPQAPDEGAFLFMATTPSTVSKAADGELRTFKGVAYSGLPIVNHWYWGTVIFDLDTMTVPDRLGMLLDHRSDQRAGSATSHTISYDKGLELSGTLTRNQHGQAVANDSDDGFPWQMSVHIVPNRIEEIEQGPVVVNGKTYQAPLTIFRDSTIRETSFCALGQDKNTSAQAFNHKTTKPPTTKPTETTGAVSMTLEELQSAHDALKAQNNTLIEQNKQFAKDARLEKIKTLFSDVGMEFKADADDVVQFCDMPAASFDAMAKNMRDMHSKFAAGQTSTKPTPPAHMFNHQAGAGQTQTEGTALDQAVLKMTQQGAK